MRTDSRLLRSVLDRLREAAVAEEAVVERVTIGERHLLVEVDSPAAGCAAGAAHRPPGEVASGVEGLDALELGGWAVDPPASTGDEALVRAVGIAGLNALSAPMIRWRSGDPMAALDGSVATIATVGLFAPALRRFRDVDVRVIERDPQATTLPPVPDGVSVSLFGPDGADRAMTGADAVFVTGSSLTYGGATDYLVAARDAGARSVVLIGATASFLPRPAFDAGATMLAGARVADIESVRSGVARGECGSDLHDAGLEKVVVTPEDVSRDLSVGRPEPDR